MSDTRAAEALVKNNSCFHLFVRLVSCGSCFFWGGFLGCVDIKED